MSEDQVSMFLVPNNVQWCKQTKERCKTKNLEPLWMCSTHIVCDVIVPKELHNRREYVGLKAGLGCSSKQPHQQMKFPN